MENKAQDEILLERASFEFSQEANCVSDNEYESITIDCESSLGIDRDGGCFYVLKTEAWSINDEADLRRLFDRIQAVIKPSETKPSSNV